MIPVRSTLTITAQPSEVLSLYAEYENLSESMLRGLGIPREMIEGPINVHQTLINMANQPLRTSTILMSPDVWNDIQAWNDTQEWGEDD